MWLVIDVMFILATIVLVKIGKRNIITLLRLLRTVGIFFVPVFIIMLIMVISGAGDKVTMLLEIGYTVLMALMLAVMFIFVRRRKSLDEIEREKFVGMISISIVSMIGIMLEFLIRIVGSIF